MAALCSGVELVLNFKDLSEETGNWKETLKKDFVDKEKRHEYLKPQQ